MKIKKLLDLLKQYTPKYSEEIISKQEMINFVSKYPDCFERTLTPGHITASAWLLDHTAEKALLLHHAKLDIWCQPGGHCDGDPDTLRTALKEATEESGIENIVPCFETIFDIDIHEIPAKGATPAHLHYDVRFLLKVSKETTPRINEESHAFIWIDKTSPIPTKERSILRMREKWIAL